LYVFTFHLFSNIFKTVLEPSHIWFCREFQALSFDKKKCFNQRDNRGENSKILTPQFILRHPIFSLFCNAHVHKIDIAIRLNGHTIMITQAMAAR
jgi:hypothetical protein